MGFSSSQVFGLNIGTVWQSGGWYTSQLMTNSATVQTNAGNSGRLVPFFVANAVTIKTIGSYLENPVPTAGAKVRWAIYPTDSQLKPTSPMLWSLSIASAVTIPLSGPQLLSIALTSGSPAANQTLTPGLWYLGMKCDGVGATPPSWDSIDGSTISPWIYRTNFGLGNLAIEPSSWELGNLTTNEWPSDPINGVGGGITQHSKNHNVWVQVV